MSYQKTFLSDVILRVDYVSIEESLKKTIFPDIRNICVKYFPIPEERNVETQQVLVTNEPGVQNTVINKEQYLEWHFFGIIRKKDEKSHIVLCEENPIKTSYEILWDELRNPSESSVKSVFNTMRRILEHYFQVIGGIKYEECINKFEGEDNLSSNVDC